MFRRKDRTQNLSDGIEGAVHPGGLHLGAARALIPWLLRERTDHRDSDSRRQRQRTITVLQQHGALLGAGLYLLGTA